MSNKEEEIFRQLKSIFNEFVVFEQALEPSDNLRTNLGIDSIDMVDIIVKIEDTYSIRFIDKEFNKMKTVEDLVQKIKERTHGN